MDEVKRADDKPAPVSESPYEAGDLSVISANLGPNGKVTTLEPDRTGTHEPHARPQETVVQSVKPPVLPEIERFQRDFERPYNKPTESLSMQQEATPAKHSKLRRILEVLGIRKSATNSDDRSGNPNHR